MTTTASIQAVPLSFLFGSTREELIRSICFPICPRTRTLLDAADMSQTCQELSFQPARARYGQGGIHGEVPARVWGRMTAR